MAPPHTHPTHTSHIPHMPHILSYSPTRFENNSRLNFSRFEVLVFEINYFSTFNSHSHIHTDTHSYTYTLGHRFKCITVLIRQNRHPSGSLSDENMEIENSFEAA